MSPLRKSEILNVRLAITVFLVCFYVMAAMIGFRYGYQARMNIENPNADSIQVAVHGKSMLGPIAGGIVLCGIFAFLYLTVVLRAIASNSMRIFLLAAAAIAISYTLYYKYVVYTLTGTPGFLNPYEQIFVLLTVAEISAFLMLVALIAIETRRWGQGKVRVLSE